MLCRREKAVAEIAEREGEASVACRCCIVGGGPAGMMLGLLLARAGVETIVVEKHADFLRDFRGDTIHPSTLEALNDLGLLGEFLALPHSEVQFAEAEVGDVKIPIADFSTLPTIAKFVAFMPQWDFLDFLAAHAKAYPGFRLMMQTRADTLIVEDGRVVGVDAETSTGPIAIRADLTIACDGRHSTLRQAAGFVPEEIGAPMDVLWFRVPRHRSDGEAVFARIAAGQILVRFNRGEYWQCAYVIPKGSAETLETQGIESLRSKMAALAPAIADRLTALESFDDVKLLTVAVDRLPLWHREGLLCIGDAAHAMSPIGGVGINLAIQDAIATANLLAEPLARGDLITNERLAEVQKRRAWPTKATQAIQVLFQNKLVSRALASRDKFEPPFLMRLFLPFAFLRRLPARVIGIGVRPERIRSPRAS
jgi:2-polyprenyl-6-methoxyphenol hydroxylase-like FAD-dependent oxidoreductase